MTYGFDYRPSELEQAFHRVELELRRLGVTNVTIEYSEGCEVAGPGGSARKVSIWSCFAALSGVSR